jgi:hypothetical protein
VTPTAQATSGNDFFDFAFLISTLLFQDPSGNWKTTLFDKGK